MARTLNTTLYGVAALALAAASPAPVVHGQSGPGVELISLGTNGLSAAHQSGSDGIIPARTRISADGRFVVFESYAANVVCVDDDFSTRDIFVRDRLTGGATVASVAWDGGEANHNSFDPVISAAGRFVAFASQATNLVSGDTNGFNDIFVRDLQTGVTTRVSVSSIGEQANSVSHGPDISADGRYVVFYSGASNLVSGDDNGTWDVFVHDRVSGDTERVSVSSAGVESTCCDSTDASITADGRYVAFLSQGRLDPSVNNNAREIYIRDRVARTTTLIPPAADGSLSNAGIRHADISADGRFVAFQSNSDNIVVPDANGFVHDVFVKDLQTGAVMLASRATDGTQGNHDSWMPSVSADGRYVAFHSWANNLVPGDTNVHPFHDVFVRDTQLGTTTRVNVTPSGGEADGTSTTASISADGSLVYFESTATNLVPGDLVNGFQDAFLAGPPFPRPGGHSFQFASPSTLVPEAGGPAVFSVFRTGPPCSTASVQYATADGTATAGTDYVAASGTLTFGPDQWVRTFEVVLLDESLVEPDETVAVALSQPTGGLSLGSPAAATLTIQDDDANPNRPPVAADDAYAARPGASNPIAAADGVLANDQDADGDALTAAVVAGPSHGALALAADGSFTYTPEAGFTGSDTFTYRARDVHLALSSAATVTIFVPEVSGCRPVTPAAAHPDPNACTVGDFMGDAFRANRRLTPIEDGTVPCVEVDTMEVTRCSFRTGPDLGDVGRLAQPPSGPWIEDTEGQRYAVAGQPVMLDDDPVAGAYVVGTVPEADGRVPCVAATGHDVAGSPAPGGSDLIAHCVLETAGAETNTLSVDSYGRPYRLKNFVTRHVGTSSLVHPDGVEPVAVDPVRGIAWYTGEGAALNDMGGTERDETGTYYLEWTRCHLVVISGGVQVPAAKRPSTRSYPAPGVIDVETPIRWLTVNPYVTIANDAAVDPRVVPPPAASFTVSVGLNTLWLDASGSTGDVVRYTWDLDWTPANPDADREAPTVTLPLFVEGARNNGWVKLTVTGRDGQVDVVAQLVDFRSRVRFPPRR